MDELVLCTVTDGVADLRLNRPDKRNALNDELFAALRTTVTETLPATDGLRAVIVSGNGEAFCAGRDTGALRPAGTAASTPNNSPGQGQPIVAALMQLPVPVIAAVHGAAIGGGFQLALAADVRFIASTTRFAMREIDYGLTVDMGGTQLLPRIVGYELAFELIQTGRALDATEALALGLALRVVDDPLAEARAFASALLDRSPTALAYNKALLQASRSLSIRDGFALEQHALLLNRGSANQREAVRARVEQRAPRFTVAPIEPLHPH